MMPDCGESWIPALEDYIFPDPGELLFPQDLPCDKIVQLGIWPVLDNSLGKHHGDPWKLGQFLNTGSIEINLRLRGRLHGHAWAPRRSGT